MDAFASKNGLFFYTTAVESSQKMRAIKTSVYEQQQNKIYDKKSASSKSSILDILY